VGQFSVAIRKRLKTKSEIMHVDYQPRLRGMDAELICIIDASGSMDIVKNEAISGFNTFVEDQKKVPGEAALTYVQFNNVVTPVYQGKPLNQVQKLDGKTYRPNGMTALYRAICDTIEETSARYSKAPESKPAQVIVAILTDGLENVSGHSYPVERVKRTIEEKKGEGWQFIFLGANQDVFETASNLGIDPNSAVSYTSTGIGTQDAYTTLSWMATTRRIEALKK
jgi:hypothetical protein